MTKNKNIKKSNSDFKEMSKAERRVAIAKDVIAQLRVERYNAQMGIYVDFGKLNYGTVYSASENKKDSCEIINKLGTCEVCARGALYLSHFRKNKTKVPEADFLYELKCGSLRDMEGLSEYGDTYEFSVTQLEMIESAFEGDGLFSEDTQCDDEVIDQCIHYCDGINNEHDRLLVIMQNIIDHNGTFVPSVKYKIVKE